MSRFSFFAVALPVIVLAACADSSTPDRVLAPVAPEAMDPLATRGRVIAQTVCAECHGADFSGAVVGETACPGLSAVKPYSLAQFNTLLVLGVARDGDRIDALMAATTSLDEEDRTALYHYFIRYVDNR